MRMPIAILTAFVLFAGSCKKDDVVENPTPTPEIAPNYYPMSIGDYWVYEVFYVDSNGVDSAINQIDSVVITNDTVINGETYFVHRGTHFIFQKDPNSIVQVLRDSSGYLINPNGKFYFSDNDFTTKFGEHAQMANGDTLFYMYRKMVPGNTQKTVPAGTFLCMNSQLFYHHNDPRQKTNPKVYPFLYAENVGLVLETIGYASQLGFYERRLIDYQVAIAIP